MNGQIEPRKWLPVRILSVLMLAFAFGLVLCGCKDRTEKSEDIYIIYTGDVHCADDENIGYAGLASYKEYLEGKSEHVLLVDTGDAIQGDFPGSSTKGEYIIERMNEVGYDYAAIGNHEFDYGLEQLSSLLKSANAEYLCCNVNYSGSKQSLLEDLKPYAIRTVGKVKLGFVGIAMPRSTVTANPKFFMEDGRTVYDFGYDATGEALFLSVQKAVDDCRKEGADYVILLSHLGDTSESSPLSSRELIAATEGIDVVLDGHAHSVIPCDMLSDKNGKPVLLSSTGTKLTNIGTLMITESGNLQTGIISSYSKKDEKTVAAIEKYNNGQAEYLSKKLASASFAMPVSVDGVRVTRNREAILGNFVADAFRFAGETDIGIVNGGALRDELPMGEITIGDVRNLMPFQNLLCTVKVKGSELADALEYSYSQLERDAVIDGKAVGEAGGFLHLSGLRCEVNTAIESSVVIGEDGMYEAVAGARRVTDIQVQEKDGGFVPLDPEKEYTLASQNFLLQGMGDGFSMFADNEFIISEGTVDYQVVVDYILSLGDRIPERYAEVEGRIIVK